MTRKLAFTGERAVPGAAPLMLIWAHTARYQFIREAVRGKDVLDAGSGEGYGSHYLAQYARTVMGVDISQESTTHALATYQQPNLDFGQMDISHLAFADRLFDVVCSFEVIEHLSDIPRFLDNIRRVLRPGGTFYVSTPNGSLDHFSTVNPYHEKEFTLQEFRDALAQHFPMVDIYGQFCLRRAREWVYIKSTQTFLRSPGYRKVVNALAPLYFSSGKAAQRSTDPFWVENVNPGTFAFRRTGIEQARFFMAVCRVD